MINEFVDETESFIESYFGEGETIKGRAVDFNQVLDDLRFMLKRVKKKTSTQIVNSESTRFDRWVKNERVAQQSEVKGKFLPFGVGATLMLFFGLQGYEGIVFVIEKKCYLLWHLSNSSHGPSDIGHRVRNCVS